MIIMTLSIASCAQGNIFKTTGKNLTSPKNSTTKPKSATATAGNNTQAQNIPINTTDNTYNQTTPEPTLTKPDDPIIPAVAPPVRPINSFEDLKAILAFSDAEINRRYYVTKNMIADDIAESLDSDRGSAEESNAEPSENETSGSDDYSETNIQVEGVDEGDVIKNDGQYIYRINNRKLDLIKAWPVESMSLEARIMFDNSDFYPTDAYINGNRLAILGSAPRKPYIDQCSNVVRILIYDISNKKNPVLIKDAEVEGYMLSSRRIGDYIYIITNRQLLYRILEKVGEEGALPAWQINDGKGFRTPDYSEIGYIPDASASNYIITASINMMDNTKDIKLSAFLGSGQNVYMSAENLYISVPVTYYENKPELRRDASGPPTFTIMPIWHSTRTRIYRLPVSKGVIGEPVAGEVQGIIINQFSMDEYSGYFRIGTTDTVWNNGGNNLYVLNMDMKLVGSMEGLAKGEKIYSTRFMGKKAYMVTFRTVDPLFVFDLSVPEKPQMTGYLKIPGYSDYLHPYDESHLIGFGKDALEVSGQPYFLGMKLSLFDVSNPAEPAELFKQIIGDRGTDSSLLYNHKALLFSREKKLLAFPVSLYTVRPENIKPGTNVPPQGDFKVQGLCVFDMDLEKGFVYKGIITHYYMTSEMPADGYSIPKPERDIIRSVYIGDVLYTLSDEIISANRISDLKELHVLRLQ